MCPGASIAVPGNACGGAGAAGQQQLCVLPGPQELSKRLLEAARTGDGGRALNWLVETHPAYAQNLSVSPDLRSLVMRTAKKMNGIMGIDCSELDGREARVLWSVCDCVWHSIGFAVKGVCGKLPSGASPMDAQLRSLAESNDSLRGKLSRCRRDYLRELTELRERCRRLDPDVAEALSQLLEEEPVMFFEPFNFILDDATKEFVDNTVEEKLKLLMLKGWKKGGDKELLERLATLEAGFADAEEKLGRIDSASSAEELLTALERHHPELWKRICGMGSLSMEELLAKRREAEQWQHLALQAGTLPPDGMTAEELAAIREWLAGLHGRDVQHLQRLRNFDLDPYLRETDLQAKLEAQEQQLWQQSEHLRHLEEELASTHATLEQYGQADRQHAGVEEHLALTAARERLEKALELRESTKQIDIFGRTDRSMRSGEDIGKALERSQKEVEALQKQCKALRSDLEKLYLYLVDQHGEDVAQDILKEAGVEEFRVPLPYAAPKQYTAFDRLYEDAQRRMKRMNDRMQAVLVMQEAEITKCDQAALDAESRKQVDKLRSLHSVSVTTNQEFAAALGALQKYLMNKSPPPPLRELPTLDECPLRVQCLVPCSKQGHSTDERYATEVTQLFGSPSAPSLPRPATAHAGPRGSVRSVARSRNPSCERPPLRNTSTPSPPLCNPPHHSNASSQPPSFDPSARPKGVLSQCQIYRDANIPSTQPEDMLGQHSRLRMPPRLGWVARPSIAGTRGPAGCGPRDASPQRC